MKGAEHIKGKLIAGAVTAVTAGLIIDSENRFQTTQYRLRFDSLPPAFDGFRIVQLSDLHGKSFGRDSGRLIRAVLALKPDIIVLTGDTAGSRRQLKALPPLLDALCAAAPVYAVNGNHEWFGGCAGELAELMARHGARLLQNAWEPLCRDGERILICGAEDPLADGYVEEPPRLAERLRREHPEDFVLWLAHRNSYAAKHWALPVQLVLCGHGHGGVVRLPGLGGLCDVSHTPLARYEAGLYRGRDFVMAVSRGLGSCTVIPRLFNRPEIVCVTLGAAR